MNEAEKLRLCKGCRNNFYNRPDNKCWFLQQARPVGRVSVGIWQNPPYRWRPQQTLNCHCPETDMAWLGRDDSRVVDDSDEAVRAWLNEGASTPEQLPD